jgi:hypothetical protein
MWGDERGYPELAAKMRKIGRPPRNEEIGDGVEPVLTGTGPGQVEVKGTWAASAAEPALGEGASGGRDCPFVLAESQCSVRCAILKYMC